MTAAIWPSATDRVTSETARKPPNDFDRPFTSSTFRLDGGFAPSAAAEPRPAGRQAAYDATGEGEQQHDQDLAQHQRPVFGVRRDLLVEDDQRRGADHGTPEMLDAAQNGHDHDLG